ncbi:MAG: Ech hydrogenase subunit EchB [Candidatus Hecatellales archaeon B24]|nr:MAG: Ech hydrogenase subunit EchB [Candidatus Hecatellales archaeon B24]
MDGWLLSLTVAVGLVVAAPFIGGILSGIDRKLTARMQNRVGPPIIQPFYDLLKLWGKESFVASRFQALLAFSFMVFSVVAFTLLVLAQDLLLIVFVISLADVCLVLGSYCGRSPYSYLGGRRELLQMLAYEPILILAVVNIYAATGSFMVEGVFKLGFPLVILLPGVFLALLIALPIEARKSPFDISASHHAHQEIVRGVFTEFSGFSLALIEFGHWFKLIFYLALLALFWVPLLWLGAVLAFIFYFIIMIVDNIFPRLTWTFMLKAVWLAGFTLAVSNLIVLALLGVGLAWA